MQTVQYQKRHRFPMDFRLCIPTLDKSYVLSVVSILGQTLGRPHMEGKDSLPVQPEAPLLG